MKNIIICCDGTAQSFNRNNTNVVRFFRCVKTNSEQVAFYDPGVGTFNPFEQFTGWGLGKMFGVLFGYGIRRNIEDAYRYLMDTYEENDKVCLFGFSRGAFTVRALAGMLRECGLLEKGSNNLIPYAFKKYADKGNKEVAQSFKETFSRECTPYMIGVWDTVKSLGYLCSRGRRFNQDLYEGIGYAYHAVSIDEQRPRFQPSLFNRINSKESPVTEEVWFPGVHSDIGGGYRDTALSDIPLRWMLNKARENGIVLYPDRFSEIQGNASGTMHESRKWYWKFLPASPRRIPENSRIHESVFERMERVGDYKPDLPEN